MKLKYYLRGLGIGIVVTAIIMSFTGKTEELTDVEIKIRAAKLGMVEKSVLADIQKESESSKESDKEEAMVENMPKTEDMLVAENTHDITETSEETISDTNDESADVEENVNDIEEETEIAEEGSLNTEEKEKKESSGESVQRDENVEKYIVISVNRGNGSEVVSQRVFEAGLVNSAAEYNRYLVNNGYDRRLRVGNHEIPAGATEEEIAKILCGMK